MARCRDPACSVAAQVPHTDKVVLWRRSLLNHGWPSKTDGATARFTMVDFSSEFLGLSTLFLPPDFYANATDYFKQSRDNLVRGAAEPAARGGEKAMQQLPMGAEGAGPHAVSVAVSALGIVVRAGLLGGALAFGSAVALVLLRRWHARRQYRVVK